MSQNNQTGNNRLPRGLAARLAVMADQSRKKRLRQLAKLPHATLVEVVSTMLELGDQVLINSKESTKVITAAANLPEMRINLPSLKGALLGLDLAANVDAKKTCATCAYRIGTSANQTVSTLLLAIDSEKNYPSHFDCHENADPLSVGDQKLRLCGGFAQRIKIKGV